MAQALSFACPSTGVITCVHLECTMIRPWLLAFPWKRVACPNLKQEPAKQPKSKKQKKTASKLTCYEFNFCLLSQMHVGTLTKLMMASEGEDFERQLGCRNIVLMNAIHIVIKWLQRALLLSLSPRDTLRRWQAAPRTRVLASIWPCWHANIQLPWSRTMKIYVCCLWTS